MKKIINFSNALLLAFLFTSFLNQVNAQTTTTKKNSTEQQAVKKYTCTMHPEVLMDKPGKCPKCGMTLVEKTDTKNDGMKNMHNMHNMNDSTVTKKDSTKMKNCN
ncbi:MAG: hypothetical protein A2X04_14585 [Bacteroidetes bacterium GWF2_41_9]|nr:MAG: hypothetical protein A2X03_13555 [Bacteroidetes bacterium GWA2_40_15]OFX95893.1 MAG: hypothetical protein A2X06_01275 [Bacteroidetes bacterium GWC2_40_22]OFY59594.1 MAG: hypothetical protein A2X04_14585 [Bacteroidetes bacterium GWF2_41_9]HBH85236.1 hypothetical protein [Bacteroidales bacterium]HBQ81572.1 hypothetical protein [Bacteroidales bacterium]